MAGDENQLAGLTGVQFFELTMDNTEDQDDLNRRLRKPGESNGPTTAVGRQADQRASAQEVWKRANEMGTEEFGKWLVEYAVQSSGYSVKSASQPGFDLVATKGDEQRLYQVTSRRIGERERAGVLVSPEKVDEFSEFAEQKGIATFFARVMIVPHQQTIHLVIIRTDEVPSTLRRAKNNFRKDIDELAHDLTVDYRSWPRP